MLIIHLFPALHERGVFLPRKRYTQKRAEKMYIFPLREVFEVLCCQLCTDVLLSLYFMRWSRQKFSSIKIIKGSNLSIMNSVLYLITRVLYTPYVNPLSKILAFRKSAKQNFSHTINLDKRFLLPISRNTALS